MINNPAPIKIATEWRGDRQSPRSTQTIDSPGSEVSRPLGCCCWDRGPGVLPAPGDRTSSFTAPLYDNDELGGRWKGAGQEESQSILGSKCSQRLTKVVL